MRPPGVPTGIPAAPPPPAIRDHRLKLAPWRGSLNGDLPSPRLPGRGRAGSSAATPPPAPQGEGGCGHTAGQRPRGADCAPPRGLDGEPPFLGRGVQNTGPGPSLSARRPHLLFQGLALEVAAPRALLAAPRPHPTSASSSFPCRSVGFREGDTRPGTHSTRGLAVPSALSPPARRSVASVSTLDRGRPRGRGKGDVLARTTRLGSRECLPMAALGPGRSCGWWRRVPPVPRRLRTVRL